MKDHPEIESHEKTGLPAGSQHEGTDVMDSEIFKGDPVVVLPNGERLLEENLEDYLIERLGWRYTTA